MVLLCATANALVPTILDPAHARLTDKFELILRANTDAQSPVVAPAIAFTFMPKDPRPEEAILRVVLDGDDPGEVEMQARYADNTQLLFTRRLHIDQPGADAVMWNLPSADKLTTVTLTLRGPRPAEATVVLLALDPARSLTFASRIMAQSPTPIRLMDPITPVKDGQLGLVLQLPSGSEEEALGSEITLHVDGTPHLVTIESVRRDRDTGSIYTDISVPVEIAKDEPVSIYLYDDSTRRPVGEIKVVLAPAPWKGKVITDQSIQHVAATVRNGELAVYTVTAPPGVLDSPTMIPHPGETIWLSVTSDLEEWVTEQPVLRSARNNTALAGGPGAITVTADKAGVLATFDVTTLDGGSSLYVASATNSLRVVPISANPISGREVLPFRYRGHALLRLPSGRLLLSLGEDATGPRLMARAGNQLPNWLSLGNPAAPVIENMTSSLSGVQDEELSILLLGKPWCLYSSTNPLFEWDRHPIDLPDGLDSVSIVAWNGLLHYVGVTHRNGFGVLRWGIVPMTLDQLRRSRRADHEN
jgi:hypothetical protein